MKREQEVKSEVVATAELILRNMGFKAISEQAMAYMPELESEPAMDTEGA